MKPSKVLEFTELIIIGLLCTDNNLYVNVNKGLVNYFLSFSSFKNYS